MFFGRNSSSQHNTNLNNYSSTSQVHVRDLSKLRPNLVFYGACHSGKNYSFHYISSQHASSFTALTIIITTSILIFPSAMEQNLKPLIEIVSKGCYKERIWNYTGNPACESFEGTLQQVSKDKFGGFFPYTTIEIIVTQILIVFAFLQNRNCS